MINQTTSVLEQMFTGPVITHIQYKDGKTYSITIENIDSSKNYIRLTLCGVTYTINPASETKKIQIKKHNDSNIRKLVKSKKGQY